jgi:MinD superfamily P-loop ATPase
MKQLVILSGKGGTGKTNVAAAFAHLAAEGAHPVRAILVDADVDAANLELVLRPSLLEAHDFVGGAVAVIAAEACQGCGTCVEVCRFDALAYTHTSQETPVVDPIACDGCAACVYQCPTQAIHMQPQLAGQWYRSEGRYGPLFHAALRPAQENSGKLVTMVKQQARLLGLAEHPSGPRRGKGEGGYDLVMVDGPPGIGCPVISAAAGADVALIVTEPTAAGVHDLERVLQTTQHFGVPALVCINKADLYPGGAAQIEAYCSGHGIEVVGHIPFDLTVTEAMVQGKPVTAYQPEAPASRAIVQAWQHVIAGLKHQ